MQKKQVLLALLRNVICGDALPEGIEAACTAETLEGVYELAAKHDLAHLVGKALEPLNLPQSDALNKSKLATKQAIFRYVRMDTEFKRICAVLEEAQIPYIPLKGSVLRSYYPEPWMRTSSDIDILVPEPQLEIAVAHLQKAMQFTASEKGNHDVCMYSPNGVHLELHYRTMVKSDEISATSRVMSHIWEDATPVQPGGYCYRISDELFYFYHIAHMAKHFSGGGCGIRPYLDLWILNQRIGCDAAKAAKLLKAGDMMAFAQASEKMVAVWFADAKIDQITEQLEEYILWGGVYGSLANHVTLFQSKRGGKFRYAMSRIFLSYDIMRHYYPILQKNKWLTPFYHVSRWLKIIFKGGLKRALREMKFILKISRKQRRAAKEMLEYLDLE